MEEPRQPRSRHAAVRRHRDAQQVRKFFLDRDDGVSTGQTPREIGVIPLQKCHLRLKRVRLFGFRAAFGRRQRSECARISLAAPIAQGGGIDAFAAQDRTDPASLGGSVGFGEHACLVPGRECSPARAGR